MEQVLAISGKVLHCEVNLWNVIGFHGLWWEAFVIEHV